MKYSQLSSLLSRDDLGLEVWLVVPVEELLVHVMTPRLCEPPRVLDLPAQVQIELGDHQTVSVSAESRCPGTVRRGHVRAPVKVPKVTVRPTAVAAGEGVRKHLGSRAIDCSYIEPVCDGGIARLDGP